MTSTMRGISDEGAASSAPTPCVQFLCNRHFLEGAEDFAHGVADFAEGAVGFYGGAEIALFSGYFAVAASGAEFGEARGLADGYGLVDLESFERIFFGD